MKTLSVWLPRPDAKEKTALSDSVVLHGLPVMTIEGLPLSEQAIASYLQADTLFFVSQHAVQCFFSQLSAANRHPIQHKQIIAIGEKTQQALLQQGIQVTVVARPPFTSESLLNNRDFLQLVTAHIAIVCAEGGRTVLSDFWQDIGKKVTRIVCYRRNKAKLSQQVMVEFLNKHSIRAISISSCEIADAVLMNLKLSGQCDFWQWSVFAFSQRIADYLAVLGFQRIIVAKAANQQSLNQSILTWWEQNGTNE